jgi:hypothetical protein
MSDDPFKSPISPARAERLAKIHRAIARLYDRLAADATAEPEAPAPKPPGDLARMRVREVLRRRGYGRAG